MKRLLVACMALSVLFAASAFAQGETQIGVTAAVNPEATGTPPISETRVLHVGTDIVSDEHVVTTESGNVQMLFLDESALTIGPNSDVVLDRFVYDPDTKTGELVLAATKGVFRLVGGKISKETPIVLETPTATIGIRGGITLVKVEENPGTEATFIFGDAMTVTSGGETVEVSRPGFTVFAPAADQPPSNPVPTTQEQLGEAAGALEGASEPASEESGEGSEVPRDSHVAASGLGEAGSQNAPAAIAPQPGPAAPAEGPAPPVREDLDDEVKKASQDQGAGGGGIGIGVNVDGFAGRFIRSLTRSDGAEPSGDTISNLSLSNNRFSGSTTSGAFDLTLSNLPGNFAVASFSPFDNVTGTGFLTDDGTFVFYELIESADNTKRNFAFAGQPVTTLPASGVYFYSVQNDFLLDASVPFLRNAAGGSLIPGEIETETDAVIIWGTGPGANTPISGSAQRAFGHRTIVINGQGTAQKSAGSFAVGTVEIDGANNDAPFIEAGYYGSSRLNAGQQPFRATGDLGTLDASQAGDGTAHFFGSSTPDYFVLLSQSNTNSTTFGASELDDLFGATTSLYTPFTPVLRGIDESLGTRTSRTLRGYSGGAIQTIDSAGTLTATALFRNANGLPADIIVKTSATTNKVQADFDVTQAFSPNASDAFGPSIPDDLLTDFGDLDIGAFGDGSSTSGDSFFGDDEGFGGELVDATFTGGAPVITSEVEGVFVFADEASGFSNGFVPTGVTVCQCNFLTWGFWSAEIGRSGGIDETVHLANWVVGDVPDASSLPTTGTATFAGHAIGTKFDANGEVFQAIGNATMSYNFASPTSSTGQITQFDSDTFNLAVTNAQATRTLHFTGDITGTGVTTGALSSFAGSFVQGGGDVTAEMEYHFQVLKDAGEKISGIGALDKQ